MESEIKVGDEIHVDCGHGTCHGTVSKITEARGVKWYKLAYCKCHESTTMMMPNYQIRLRSECGCT